MTHLLKPGDTLEVNGRIRVLKCGLRSVNGGHPEPHVVLEAVGNGAAPEKPSKPVKKAVKKASNK